MIDRILVSIYDAPLQKTLFVVAFFIILWIVFSVLSAKKEKFGFVFRIINIAVFFVSVFGIIAMTLHSRQKGSFQNNFIPFAYLKENEFLFDLKRSMLMNSILFIPFSLTFPFVLGSKFSWKNALLTLVFGIMFSVCVEAVQLFLSIGKADIDDVIFNTLGVVIGEIPYIIYGLTIRKNGEKNKHRRYKHQ